MRKIITLDGAGCITPEDGFGIDKNGNFFTAIKKGGFSVDNKSIIFTFIEGNILVSIQKIIVRKERRTKNYLKLMKKVRGYERLVLQRVFYYHQVIARRNKNSYIGQAAISVSRLICNILHYLYKRISKLFNGNKSNLKKGYRYRQLFFILEQFSEEKGDFMI